MKKKLKKKIIKTYVYPFMGIFQFLFICIQATRLKNK